MTNWYWPQWDGSWKYRLLSYLANKTANIIWFKKTNASLHDESYALWGTENDRIIADTWFLRRLLQDCEWKFYKKLVAYLFFFSVRILWTSHFNFKDVK